MAQTSQITLESVIKKRKAELEMVINNFYEHLTTLESSITVDLKSNTTAPPEQKREGIHLLSKINSLKTRHANETKEPDYELIYNLMTLYQQEESTSKEAAAILQKLNSNGIHCIFKERLDQVLKCFKEIQSSVQRCQSIFMESNYQQDIKPLHLTFNENEPNTLHLINPIWFNSIQTYMNLFIKETFLLDKACKEKNGESILRMRQSQSTVHEAQVNAKPEKAIEEVRNANTKEATSLVTAIFDSYVKEKDKQMLRVKTIRLPRQASVDDLRKKIVALLSYSTESKALTVNLYKIKHKHENRFVKVMEEFREKRASSAFKQHLSVISDQKRFGKAKRDHYLIAYISHPKAECNSHETKGYEDNDSSDVINNDTLVNENIEINVEIKEKNSKLSINREAIFLHKASQFIWEELLQNKNYNGLFGLVNLQNTCYMNCSLQCFFHTNELTQYFFFQYDKRHKGNSPLNHYALLLDSLKKKGTKPVYPSSFWESFGLIYNEFHNHK